MKLSPICKKVYNKARWILGGGAILPVLSGCEADVQTLVLGGLENLASTLVSAFFLTLAPEEVTPVTTQAIMDIFSMLG
ncbi:MAG: hypothetical protein ACYTF1_25380 [Planctomycetota bacterium]